MTSQPRNLVVMFADVAGSAELFEKLGDMEAMHAIERCLKRMKRSVDGYRGRTMQVFGDEMLALFEAPEDASNAAIDMQHRIADLPPVSGLKLTIRIGLHYGPVVEEGDNAPGGSAVTTAARIAGVARRDQILCSSSFVDALPPHLAAATLPMPGLGTVAEEDKELALAQIEWFHYQAGSTSASSLQSIFGPAQGNGGNRLCVRYSGKAFLLDDQSPMLSIGRDLANELVLDDRKASRLHARVERRPDGFYLIDSSTNGSFVAQLGRQEVMVRRHEILLEGKGRIGFGTSSQDPAGTTAEFESL